MVHLLQKGDNSFNQELLKNMVKSIKMNDVYGPMSQILETLNKCPHFKRQRYVIFLNEYVVPGSRLILFA